MNVLNLLPKRVFAKYLKRIRMMLPDGKHSDTEERWITIGQDESGILLVLVHTFEKVLSNSERIRVISARKATKEETNNYEEGI